jgi:hypothetical protein
MDWQHRGAELTMADLQFAESSVQCREQRPQEEMDQAGAVSTGRAWNEQSNSRVQNNVRGEQGKSDGKRKQKQHSAEQHKRTKKSYEYPSIESFQPSLTADGPSASENRRRARVLVRMQIRLAAAGDEQDAKRHGRENQNFLASLTEQDFELVRAIIRLRHSGTNITISDLLLANATVKKCHMFGWPL